MPNPMAVGSRGRAKILRLLGPPWRAMAMGGPVAATPPPWRQPRQCALPQAAGRDPHGEQALLGLRVPAPGPEEVHGFLLHQRHRPAPHQGAGGGGSTMAVEQGGGVPGPAEPPCPRRATCSSCCRAWPSATRTACCTATSSPKTCSSTPTAPSNWPTSAWLAPSGCPCAPTRTRWVLGGGECDDGGALGRAGLAGGWDGTWLPIVCPTMAGGDPLVPSPRDPPGLQVLLDGRRHLELGLHLCGDGG